MTRDLIVGIILSAGLHLLLLFGDRLIPEKKVVRKVEEPPPKIELIAMPKMGAPAFGCALQLANRA